MIAYWYQGYWGVNSSGEGVSIYQGGKNWKKGVFRGAENLENFEKKNEKQGGFAALKISKISKKLKKRVFSRRRNIRKFRKNWKKEGWKVSKISKKLEKRGFRGAVNLENFEKNWKKGGGVAAPKFSKISKNMASTKSAFLAPKEDF